MNKRLVIIVTLAGLTAIVALFFASCEPPTVIYNGKSVKEWAAQLRSPDGGAREQATSAIKTLGIKAVPSFVYLLNTTDTGLRKITWSLAKRLPRKPRAMFFQGIRWPDPNDARVVGAKGLGIIGPDASQAVPLLAKALRSPVREVSLESAVALGRIGKSSVPLLIEALKDKNPDVRHLAAYALGEIGPDAQAAVPELLPMLAENDESIRSSVAYSLSRIGPPTLPHLLELVAQGKGPTREAAAKVLLEYYRSSRQGVQALAQMSVDESPAIRKQALDTLGSLREADFITMQLSIRALKDPDPQVRLSAIALLAQMGTQAQVATVPLVQCLKDESPPIRAGAARLLARISTPAKSAVPALTELLQDKDESVRAAAQEALRTIQPTTSATPNDRSR